MNDRPFDCVADDASCRPEQPCAACRRFLGALETLGAGAQALPLPATLQARLLAVPEARDQDEQAGHLYLRVQAELAADGDENRPLPADLEGGRRRAYRALRSTLADARMPEPLPAALRRRLLGIVRPQVLPWFIRDGRVAAAACLMLTVLSTLFVGDASASLGPNSPLAAQRREWWSRGQELVVSQAQDLEARAGDGWRFAGEWLERQGREISDGVEERVRQFSNTELGRRWVGPANPQGADHEPESR